MGRIGVGWACHGISPPNCVCRFCCGGAFPACLVLLRGVVSRLGVSWEATLGMIMSNSIITFIP